MNRIAYYNTDTEAEADKCDLSVPLAVNCAGIERGNASGSMIRKRKDYYLLFVITGTFCMEIGNHKYELTPNHYMLIEPDLYVHCSHDMEYFRYYWIHFTGNYAAELVNRLGISLNCTVSYEFNEELKQYFEEIFQQFISRNVVAEIRMCGSLIHLLTALSRPRKPSVISRSMEYIMEHYNEEIPIPFLAGMENLSISHYRKIFKKNTGMSPGEYIITQRINTACVYLDRYTLTVSEIADLVGYGDALYFSRVFKKKIGMTPREYRSRNDAKKSFA